jgi:hypothetical protein
MRNTYSALVGIPRRRWNDNIRTKLKKIVWKGVDWIHLAQDRHQWRALVNSVMNLGVKYRGRLQSSCIHLITLSRNFVEVR